MCVYTVLTDVASMEQQQSAKDSSKEQEEEEREDIFMDVEEQEELKAVDTEKLKPEEIKSGTTAGSGESYRKQVPPKLSDLEKLLLLPCILLPHPKPRLSHLLVYNVTLSYFIVEKWKSGVARHSFKETTETCLSDKIPSTFLKHAEQNRALIQL